MYAAILDVSAGTTFYFIEPNSEKYIYGHDIPKKYVVSKSIYNSLLFELSEDFEELKKEYIKNDLGAWTTAALQLDQTGKLSIDYGYEEILNIGLYGIQRIEVWEYETFGFLPENKKTRKLC
ncbi:antitoxin YezG family protein [Bacillus safensis]|uniref:immunity protein YezG family protein n=1 Tax=Bacillus safensis TaxID=561879 RepID=UPI00203C536F|nr:immunity protein YezG family protein [Bacillus safensis]MCM2988251.1 antitoxin YezG family protein [Bacillus safensis]